MSHDHMFEGKRLQNHVIRSVDVIDPETCGLFCFEEPNCVSLNFNKATSQCELNNSTFEGQEDKLETHTDFFYQGAKVS